MSWSRVLKYFCHHMPSHIIYVINSPLSLIFSSLNIFQFVCAHITSHFKIISYSSMTDNKKDNQRAVPLSKLALISCVQTEKCLLILLLNTLFLSSMKSMFWSSNALLLLNSFFFAFLLKGNQTSKPLVFVFFSLFCRKKHSKIIINLYC